MEIKTTIEYKKPNGLHFGITKNNKTQSLVPKWLRSIIKQFNN